MPLPSFRWTTQSFTRLLGPPMSIPSLLSDVVTPRMVLRELVLRKIPNEKFVTLPFFTTVDVRVPLLSQIPTLPVDRTGAGDGVPGEVERDAVGQHPEAHDARGDVAGEDVRLAGLREIAARVHLGDRGGECRTAERDGSDGDGKDSERIV